MKRFHAPLLLATLLAGCASAPRGVEIDTTHTAENQDSRVLFLIMHYTVGNFDSSLKTLTKPSPDGRNVSSHYLVRDVPVRTYRLVDENRRAWHAGPSYWRGHRLLNSSSIGIEIVNPGTLGRDLDGVMQYAPFAPGQIDEVIALSKEIVARHGIKPERILGHNEIQPQTKQDPGPQFPWYRLHQAGLIAWPDAAQVAAQRPAFESALPPPSWFRAQLAQMGYEIDPADPARDVWDDRARRVLMAFQTKYRPARYDGEPDAECAALLAVANAPGGMVMAAPSATRAPAEAQPARSVY